MTSKWDSTPMRVATLGTAKAVLFVWRGAIIRIAPKFPLYHTRRIFVKRNFKKFCTNFFPKFCAKSQLAFCLKV